MLTTDVLIPQECVFFAMSLLLSVGCAVTGGWLGGVSNDGVCEIRWPSLSEPSHCPPNNVQCLSFSIQASYQRFFTFTLSEPI